MGGGITIIKGFPDRCPFSLLSRRLELWYGMDEDFRKRVPALSGLVFENPWFMRSDKLAGLGGKAVIVSECDLGRQGVKGESKGEGL